MKKYTIKTKLYITFVAIGLCIGVVVLAVIMIKPNENDKNKSQMTGITDQTDEQVLSSALDDIISQPSSNQTVTDRQGSGVSSMVQSENKAVPEIVIDGNKAIQNARNSLQDLKLPIIYNENIKNPAKYTFQLSGKTQQEISNKLHDEVLDCLGYDSYLESKGEAHTKIPFDYDYYIIYKGKNNSVENFTICYRLKKQSYSNSKFNFNSDQVLEIVNENLGKTYEHIDGPSQGTASFEIYNKIDTTEGVARDLAEKVEETIENKNLKVGNNYTKYDIIYYSKTESEFIFLLFLA